jgi:hypothetical protein
MAWIFESYIVNPVDERVFMSHRFFGSTQADCRSTFNEHLGSCSYFRAAKDDGRTYEKWIQIDEDDLPIAEKV